MRAIDAPYGLSASRIEMLTDLSAWELAATYRSYKRDYDNAAKREARRLDLGAERRLGAHHPCQHPGIGKGWRKGTGVGTVYKRPERKKRPWIAVSSPPRHHIGSFATKAEAREALRAIG